jgi:CRISPR-associated protein Csx14
MAQVSFPVDLYNPGQVFASLGFLETAHALFGPAEGGFDWSNEGKPQFALSSGCPVNPVEAVLEFLAEADLERLAPQGYSDDWERDGLLCRLTTFPAPASSLDGKALPLRLRRNDQWLDVTHWCDGSSRSSFKLFAGNQRSADIASKMRDALRELWKERRPDLTADPFGITAPLGGSSFKMDARKSWTTIDAGYSPDDQKHDVEASPVVELLAAVGLEHARPEALEGGEVRYGVWRGLLPPPVARAALGGARVGVPIRLFRFTLDKAGQNKVVSFAEEEAVV